MCVCVCEREKISFAMHAWSPTLVRNKDVLEMIYWIPLFMIARCIIYSLEANSEGNYCCVMSTFVRDSLEKKSLVVVWTSYRAVIDLQEE